MINTDTSKPGWTPYVFCITEIVSAVLHNRNIPNCKKYVLTYFRKLAMTTNDS